MVMFENFSKTLTQLVPWTVADYYTDSLSVSVTGPHYGCDARGGDQFVVECPPSTPYQCADNQCIKRMKKNRVQQGGKDLNVHAALSGIYFPFVL